MGNAMPVEVLDAEDIATAVAWLVSDEARYITGVTLPVDAGLREQALTWHEIRLRRPPSARWCRRPSSSTSRRSAVWSRTISRCRSCRRSQRAMVRAMRWPLLRRLTISAGERAVPGSWALIACRKRFIDDKLTETLGNIDAVVDPRCGHGHQGVPPRTSIRHPGLRGRPPRQHRAQEGRRASARSVRCPPRFTWCPWTSSATT